MASLNRSIVCACVLAAVAGCATPEADMQSADAEKALRDLHGPIDALHADLNRMPLLIDQVKALENRR